MDTVPAPIPCARCGYRIGGLPAEGRCPECGEPHAASIDRFRFAWSAGAGALRDSASAGLVASAPVAVGVALAAVGIASAEPAVACLLLPCLIMHVFAVLGTSWTLVPWSGPYVIARRMRHARSAGWLMLVGPFAALLSVPLVEKSPLGDGAIPLAGAVAAAIYFVARAMVARAWSAIVRELGGSGRPGLDVVVGGVAVAFAVAAALVLVAGIGLAVEPAGRPGFLVLGVALVVAGLGELLHVVGAIAILRRLRAIRGSSGASAGV